MTTEATRIEYSDGIAEIVLARPEKGNPFDAIFNAELCDHASRLTSDQTVRAILIRAEGKYFSVGADFKWLGRDREALPRLLKEATATLHSAIVRLTRGDAPVIVAVHGLCVGGATALTASADFALAAESASFYAAYNRIGFVADGAGTHFIPRRVGSRRATEFFLLNETWDAPRAAQNGLVNRIVPDAALLDEARALARQLAEGPTRTYGEMKRLMATYMDRPIETQLEEEAQAIARCARTDDCWNALQSLIERKPITYQGR
ncbi:enoyl-CoA hydratase/isomerase family protein [Paracoccus sp. pheM1]|uniref:enoyl-CoA hydratase/isomerase family protein n=1 Tax=Paracoccus sp. pheM1 TaxID=2831675 RepID=UPI001BDB9174|nr:enoyl-CoA hydratase/isomerase family protein [Paracoccus sp. pheM1]MBT0782920.1 enoyl-CoA hydratase/isomerase family protein [Paracoccus sp. pheM1]